MAKFFERRRAKAAERESFCKALLQDLHFAIERQKTLAQTSKDYAAWLKENLELSQSLLDCNLKPYRKCKSYQLLSDKLKTFRQIWSNVSSLAEVLEQNERCKVKLEKINEALIAVNYLFHNKTEFVDQIEISNWKFQNEPLFKNLSSESKDLFRKSQYFESYDRAKMHLILHFSNLKRDLEAHNRNVCKSRIEGAYRLIGNVEGRRLDEQQMECIVGDFHNQLVIAGAGTGKTTTIVGKVKYLLATGKCKPEDILLLSFTKASAAEMGERLQREIGIQLDVQTFHSCGLGIIRSVHHIQPTVFLNTSKFIRDKLKELTKDEHYLKLLNRYLLYNKTTVKTEFDFKSEAEYLQYLREKRNPLVPLKNENYYKSGGEVDIADFLTMHGVKYQYEANYPHDTRTPEYPKQYAPDFFLPEYNIYIEYYGIDRKGNVPSFFKSRHGKSPSVEYREGMEWKAKTHKQYHTKLIECFAYEKFEGNLCDNLSRHLQAAGVKYNPSSQQDVWEMIRNDSEKRIQALFCTLLNLSKSCDCSIAELRAKNEKAVMDEKDRIDNSKIIELFEPIYTAYEKYLEENFYIDFNDMINQASKLVRSGAYKNTWKYVIVDEYQDISKSRFGLLKALRNSADYKLFCVGDDWQSIYRFSGSDIGYILKFQKYWGETSISRIETTYRFTKSLIDISGTFVMRNQEQIRKSLKSLSNNMDFALGYGLYIRDLRALPVNSNVLFLGRYKDDFENLKKGLLRGSARLFSRNREHIVFLQRPDLKISFMTVHKSKGLQADYVFILNNERGVKGFPSEIEDPEILGLLQETSETYPFAEERRLYYVAMTRAKKKVFLVPPPSKNRESPFYREIMESYGTLSKRSGSMRAIYNKQ